MAGWQRLIKIGMAGLFSLACSCACAEHASALDELRISRPVIKLDMGKGLLAAEPNREPVAEAPLTPGIYRSFLIWRQKYAHLAICHTDLCNGSCINYGDGCLVSAQSPILPGLIAGITANSSECPSGCGATNVKPEHVRAADCHEGGCH